MRRNATRVVSSPARGLALSSKTSVFRVARVLLNGAAMMNDKWLNGAWSVTETNRKARFYKITPLGLRQLEREQNRWLELSSAVAQVLKLA